MDDQAMKVRAVLTKVWGFGQEDVRYTRWLTGLDMTADEYAALKESIANGTYTGRIVFATDGSLLDGHHAYKAYLELGAKPGIGQVVVMDVSALAEADILRQVLVWEFARKHVSNEQKREIVAKLFCKQGGDIGVKEVRRITGLDRQTIRDVRDELQEGGEITPFLFKGGRGKKAGVVQVRVDKVGQLPTVMENLGMIEAKKPTYSVRGLKREASTQERTKRLNERAEAACPEHICIQQCRFQQLRIEPATADVIWTDILWHRKHRRLVDDLAPLAAKWLKPRGLLCVYAGINKDYANDVLRRTFVKVTEFVVYHAAVCRFSGRFTGKHQSILVFSKETISNGQWKDRYGWGVFDACETSQGEKEWHPHQRTLKETLFFLEQLTRPGYVICDPCGGSFTPAVAALRLGCRFVGCDDDTVPNQHGVANAELGRRRVAEAWMDMQREKQGDRESVAEVKVRPPTVS